MNNTFDNSMISTYQKCPMSFYLQYERGLRKRVLDDSNSAMNFGSAVHSYLESFYKRKKHKFEYEEPEDMPQYSEQALFYFCETFKNKYSVSDREFEILETEQTSKFKLGKYWFIVKKDGAFKMNDNIFGMEHKTAKSISFNFFNKFFINSQISAQCYDVMRKYKQCSGIMLTAGEIKHLKRKPTGAYDGTYATDSGWVACKFNRDFVNRNKDEVEDWKTNAIAWIDEIQRARDNNKWLKSDGLWGGIICASCPYKEVCKVSNGTDLDGAIVDCLYETVDPYEYLKEE